MNPVAYEVKLHEPLRFLLVGDFVYYKYEKKPERVWGLNIYSSAKSRQVAAKKMKRGSSDIIFIEWDVTMEQIISQGKMTFPVSPDKILLRDKLDIFRQLQRQSKGREK